MTGCCADELNVFGKAFTDQDDLDGATFIYVSPCRKFQCLRASKVTPSHAQVFLLGRAFPNAANY